MSSTFDMKSLPLHRLVTLVAGVLLFIALFFPWVNVSADMGEFGSISGSTNGWNGIGTFVGVLAILLIAWEVARLLGAVGQLKVSPDLVTAGLAGLVALFGLVQFIRALTYGPIEAELAGVSIGPHVGAFLVLLFSLGLGYAAFLAFQAAGGQETLKSVGQAATIQGGDTAASGPDTGTEPDRKSVV